MWFVYLVSQRQAEAFPKHQVLGRSASLASPPLCKPQQPVWSPGRALITLILKSTLSRSESPPQDHLAPLCPQSQHNSWHIWQFDKVNPSGHVPSNWQWKQYKAVHKGCWLFSQVLRADKPIFFFFKKNSQLLKSKDCFARIRFKGQILLQDVLSRLPFSELQVKPWYWEKQKT